MLLACVYKALDANGFFFIRTTEEGARMLITHPTLSDAVGQLGRCGYEPLGTLEVFRTTSAPERKQFEDVESYVVCWFRKG